MTLTTERANPLRQWNPGWGGCSAARRPVAAANKLFLRRSVFVKLFTHEMTLPIARLEAGDHEPSLAMLSRLARVLGIEFHIDITPDTFGLRETA